CPRHVPVHASFPTRRSSDLNRDHLNSLITALQDKGLNVYPIAAYASRAKWLKQLKPDLAVAMPHGRFSLGGADSTIAWLQENNRSEEHTSELQSRENLVCRL